MLKQQLSPEIRVNNRTIHLCNVFQVDDQHLLFSVRYALLSGQ